MTTPSNRLPVVTRPITPLISYDGLPATRAFWGASLPHWDVLGRPIFLTIHIHGAIPRAATEGIRRQTAELAQRHDTAFVRRLKLVFRNMEAWLDRPEHPPVLTRPEICAMLREAIATREARGWWRVLHWVVMPSHLHILYVGGTVGMKTVVSDFKRWTGRQAAAIAGRNNDRFWQREWFDHWSRSAVETERIASYIRENPVRAGLTANAEKWPYGSWSV